MPGSIRVQGQAPEGSLIPLAADDRGRLYVTAAQEALAGPTQGPGTATITNSVNVILIAAPGAGFAIRVSVIQVTFDGGTTQGFKAGTGGTVQVEFFSKGDASLAPFVMDPPWLLPENTAFVTQRTNGNKDVQINYHFFVDTI